MALCSQFSDRGDLRQASRGLTRVDCVMDAYLVDFVKGRAGDKRR